MKLACIVHMHRLFVLSRSYAWPSGTTITSHSSISTPESRLAAKHALCTGGGAQAAASAAGGAEAGAGRAQ